MAKLGRPKKITTQKIPQKSQPSESYLEKINSEVSSNQSRLSMILGALIVLVIGILIFNYFNRSKPSLGPSQQTEQTQEDVATDKLPGKYTVKDGDTLFTIAEKYYHDGSKFEMLVKANNLSDANSIVTGQVLEIPKLEEVLPSPAATPTESGPTESPSPAVSPSETPDLSPAPSSSPQPDEQSSTPSDVSGLGKGGGNTTIWGPKIESSTYTVQEGDWLSTISARAYGDIFSYQKIATANNISNPDYIVPGMVLTIPR